MSSVIKPRKISNRYKRATEKLITEDAKTTKYKVGDLIAIQRTQTEPGQKFYSKFLGPYEVTSALRNNRYLVQKSGEHEGPNRTSADYMKLWPDHQDLETDSDSDPEDDAHESIEGDAPCRMAKYSVVEAE